MHELPDNLDELIDAFLPPGGSHPQPDREEIPVPTELIIMGHLPSMGSLWLTPFASMVAGREGCTALIRLDRPQPRLEVHGPAGTTFDLGPDECLRETMLHIVPNLQRCLIRPPLDVVPSGLLNSGADSLVLLTGTNQAAIMHAVTVIQQICAASEETGYSLPDVSLAVLGAAENESHEASRVLNDQVDIRVPLRYVLPAIDERGQTLAERLYPLSPHPSLSEIIGWCDPVLVAPCLAPSNTGHDPAMDEEEQDAYDLIDPIPFPGVSRGIDGTFRLAPKPASVIEMRPASTPGPVEDTPTTPVPLLASWLDAIEPVQARCPGYESIEMALDVPGNMHLLCRDSTVHDLVVVEAWARKHWSLLRLTCPRDRIVPDPSIRQHLFTDDPLAVLDVMGGQVNLHLLDETEVEGRRGWYCTPLYVAGE